MPQAGTILKIIRTSRPLFWLVHISLFIVGAVASGKFFYASKRFFIPILLLTAPFSLFVYAINDYYDLESDRHNPRKGGVFGEKHTNTDAQKLRAQGFAGLATTLVGFAFFGLERVALVVILSIALYAYSAPPLRLKSVPVADALVGGGFYLSTLVFMGFVLSGGNVRTSMAAIKPSLAAVFLVGFTLHAIGAVIDEIPDRKQGVVTSAIYFGAQKVILFCLCLVLLAMIALTLPVFFKILLTLVSLICLLFLYPAIRKNTKAAMFISKYCIYVFSFSTALLALFKPELII